MIENLKLKIPPAVTFLFCLGLMWAIQHLTTNSWLLFEFRVYIALLFVAIGALLGVLSVLLFIRSTTTVNPHKPNNASTFVQTGVYQISRNPMYLGLLFVLIAAIFYWGNTFTLAVPPLFIWYMTEFQIKPEEEALKQKFGQAYQTYLTKVNRWV